MSLPSPILFPCFIRTPPPPAGAVSCAAPSGPSQVLVGLGELLRCGDRKAELWDGLGTHRWFDKSQATTEQLGRPEQVTIWSETPDGFTNSSLEHLTQNGLCLKGSTRSTL